MNATDVLHDNKDNICLTSYCMDCIHHEYFRYQEDHFTHEHCQIWGKDGCHSTVSYTHLTLPTIA